MFTTTTLKAHVKTSSTQESMSRTSPLSKQSQIQQCHSKSLWKYPTLIRSYSSTFLVVSPVNGTKGIPHEWTPITTSYSYITGVVEAGQHYIRLTAASRFNTHNNLILSAGKVLHSWLTRCRNESPVSPRRVGATWVVW